MIRRGIIALMTGLLSLMLISCTSSETIKEDTLKADILEYLNNYSDVKWVSPIGVKSIESSKDKKVFETYFDFSNTDASFSAEMTLTYEKVDGKLEIANHAFNLISTNTINDIVATTPALTAFIAKNQLTFFENRSVSTIYPEYLTLESATKNSPNSTTLVYNYSINRLNWSFIETITIQADFKYPDGWHYTMKDWSYSETSNWDGTWQIKFFNPDGTLAQTIYDLVITGKLSITKDSSSKFVEENTLWAKFTYEGESISTNVHFLNRPTNVCGILLMFNNNVSERFIRIGINLINGSTSETIVGFEYYASSLYYQKGELTKIK